MKLEILVISCFILSMISTGVGSIYCLSINQIVGGFLFALLTGMFLLLSVFTTIICTIDHIDEKRRATRY